MSRLNPPRQARSRRTLERLVSAALELLTEQGPDAVTVQAIVDRAGSSVGSFYARFGGKEDLLAYLGERIWRDALERWEAALAERRWDDLELPELARAAVGLLVEAGRYRGAQLRALERLPGGGGDAYAEFRQHVLTGLAELMLARRRDMTHQDPELAVHLGLAAVLGLVDARAPGDVSFGPDTLGREGALLLKCYLAGGAASEPGAAPGDVEFFDIWG